MNGTPLHTPLKWERHKPTSLGPGKTKRPQQQRDNHQHDRNSSFYNRSLIFSRMGWDVNLRILHLAYDIA